MWLAASQACIEVVIVLTSACYSRSLQRLRFYLRNCGDCEQLQWLAADQTSEQAEMQQLHSKWPMTLQPWELHPIWFDAACMRGMVTDAIK